MEEILEKVKKIQEKFSPFITIAEKVEFGKGKLSGIAISVKDNICTKGMRTTAGSKILENYVPPFDASVVEKCKREGAFIIGKTAMDEFGFGTFSTNCAFSIPKNPYDLKRSCGGSSGGAACLAAVADFPHIAIAESTGGSISCPASFCGVVGLTPTYGRVSRWGLIDYANSLDKIGCISKTVEDVALLLSVIAGPDEFDSTVLNLPKEDFTRYLIEDVKNVRIGVPKEYFEVDEKIAKIVWDGIKILESNGANYGEISLPSTKYALYSYYIIAMAEASTNLAKFCGMRYGLELELKGNFDEYFSKVRGIGFGEEAKRRIILGTFARMAGFRDAYYLKALKVRTKIIQEFKQAFKKFDVLIAPTMPIVAPKFEEIEKLEPIEQYMMDVLTVAPNLAGIPHISIPCGFLNGLPVGMHIIANHFQEGKALRVAYTFEKVKR
ncbi:MAG: Asp-tRNA(Asn)/Glu-tRNA(Gln) amidotransferase subunit GatA [Candidatus Aenigmatarchaeota archaeon]